MELHARATYGHDEAQIPYLLRNGKEMRRHSQRLVPKRAQKERCEDRAWCFDLSGTYQDPEIVLEMIFKSISESLLSEV